MEGRARGREVDVQGGREDDAEKYGRGEQRDRRQKEKSRFPSQSRDCVRAPALPVPATRPSAPSRHPRARRAAPRHPEPRRAPTRVDGGGQSARGKKRGQSWSERAQQPGKRNNLRAVLTFLV